MTSFKKILCFFVLLASTTVSQADAWHGRHCFGWHHRGLYSPVWSSYSRVSFYGGYGYGGYGYGAVGFSPYCYSNYWPSVYYTSYVPTYYAPVYHNSYYSPYVAPVIYSNVVTGFPSCAVTPSVSNVGITAYTVKKPTTSSVPFKLASQAAQKPQVSNTQFGQAQAPTGRYVLAQAASASSTAMDSAPDDLIAAADAILAAGGYRQAAQAYAQIVVKHGNSDRLVTRRFIAQVANGDFEQAAVVVELAAANGNKLDFADVPQRDLQVALGDSKGLIALRSESLAANALEKSEDAVPMLTLAHWLALSGDNQRADLFKARANQMQQVEVGLLVRRATIQQNAAK